MDRMIMGALRKTAPHVLDLCLSRCGDDKQLRKTEMLEELMKAEGAQSVIHLSRHFPLETPSSSWIYPLLNSPTPQAMIQKLGIYDSHFHISRRLELRGASERHLMVENCASLDDLPTVADELFLAGALKNLLLQIGCKGLKMEWLAVRSGQLRQVLEELQVFQAPVEQNTRWRYTWDRQKRPEHIYGLDEYLIGNTDLFTAPYKSSLTQRVEEFLIEDLTTRPSMEETAEKLGISARTLQRKLQEEGTSYSRLYSDLRIKTAARLLRQSDASLTEIGFLSGFSDSAHFSREFKKVQNMSPKAYRDKFQNPEN
jgi:AraC-like DNA-binding protein